ncbi:T-cell surface glycoprotein CD1e, membrane-associated-like isoform X2 [Saccopteryx bilineata]|uniref:T-cell surface glycoprotein CD1e, membrane-associated-like isoform X2 n=1 Tax=Saccopteryx bilineata TaxID=59482 RepID=UPI00338E580B
MLLLLPLLFKGILCHGPGTGATRGLAPHHPATEEPPSFRLLQISSFANQTWQHMEGSAWLGELQTHRLDPASGIIQFLWPWSGGNFSKEELKNILTLLQLYIHSFPLEVQAFSSQFQLEYPFEFQASAGCAMHSGKAPESFINTAYQGSDFLSFQGNFWKPSPGAGILAQSICKMLNRFRIIKEVVQSLLSDTCPRFLSGLLQGGKSDLERQVKPQAWVTKGSSPGPGRLLLVCHVSGFHPKPVWVIWMQGQQEQRGTRLGEVLPNADGTWYLRVTLDVAAGQAAGLYCRVKHSSLGGRDIIIHWDGYPISLILICLAIAVTLVTVVVVGSWIKQHSSNQNVSPPHVPSPTPPMEGNTQEPRGSGNHLCLAQRSWIKNKLLKKWKMILNQL